MREAVKPVHITMIGHGFVLTQSQMIGQISLITILCAINGRIKMTNIIQKIFNSNGRLSWVKGCILNIEQDQFSDPRIEMIAYDIVDEINDFKIKRVIFNNPATIVFWNDGTKTVVKCSDKDKYDKEKGLAMAISERVLGSYSAFKREVRKWEDKPCEKKI